MSKKKSISREMTQKVFNLAADGLSAKEIAKQLNISLFEVDVRTNIFNEAPAKYVNENVIPGKLFNVLPQSLIAAFKEMHVTEREGEVLYLAAQGWKNKNIANFLEISRRTVEVHRFNGQPKIHARNISDVVRFVMSAAPSLIRASKLPEYDF